MSEHNSQFIAERRVSANEAAPGLTEKLGAGARPPAKRLVRRTLLATAALLGLAGAGDYGWSYWTVGRFQVATDDAYVKADSTTIAPKISGYIAAVLVGDNETVKAGQPLARIDDRDFRVAVDQAKAEVAAAEAAILTKQATLEAQKATVEATRAAIDVDKANQTFATQDDKRYATLAASGYGSLQNAQQAASRSAASRASVERDQASLDAAVGQIAVIQAGVVEAKAALARAQALKAQAELNLSYTTIAAPVDGVVGARSLRVGQYVQAGTQLMAVVPLSAAYIVANYKETQLANVRAGQKVEIEVDTFPGRPLHGRVDSLAPASGQEFALLPPDNATGNFTKVVQRIPVKITLDPDSASAFELRPGMSVYPSIDTKAAALQTAAASAPRS